MRTVTVVYLVLTALSWLLLGALLYGTATTFDLVLFGVTAAWGLGAGVTVIVHNHKRKL